MFVYNICVLLLVILYVNDVPNLPSLYSSERSKETLKMVHVLFRHGERTNDIHFTYSNYSYSDMAFYPYGVAQLTKNGMKKQYMVGKDLRSRYNTFLGEMYKPGIIEAISTNKDRTKTSLLLVLAALFPSKNTELDWSDELNWLPVPYSYVSDYDPLLVISIFYCANYIKEYERYLSSPQGLKFQEKYSQLYKYLTTHTGKVHESILDVFATHFRLLSEKEFGLHLPAWSSEVFPHHTEKAVIDQYTIGSTTTLMRKLSGGFLLKKIIQDMKKQMNKHPSPKIFIYSGHELNIIFLLHVLGAHFPHIPPYSAYLLLELHKIKGVYGIRIYYQDYSDMHPKALMIPRCDYFCPFEQFLELVEENLPEETDDCGNNTLLVKKYLTKVQYTK